MIDSEWLLVMSSRKKKYKWLIVSALAAVLLAGALAFGWWKSEYYASISANGSENPFLYVRPDMSLDDVCHALQQGGFVANGNDFRRYMSRKNYAHRIKVGRYRIDNSMTNRTLAQHLIFGMQEPVKLRFNNVRLTSELARKLSQQLLLDSAEIDLHLHNVEFLKKYDLTPQTAIALFIPNTYEVYWDISIERLFDRMQREYRAFWNADRLNRAKKLNLTPMQVSILASIVEEESNIAADRQIIAGLYLNRMRRGIPLQACPTVRFAVGDFTITRVLNEHLKIESPYNTYKYRGLPPGPIRMASIGAIDAVLHHMPNDYLYMCASERMDGTHNFARTLAEHNRNAAKYHRAYVAWKKNR